MTNVFSDKNCFLTEKDFINPTPRSQMCVDVRVPLCSLKEEQEAEIIHQLSGK